MISLVVLFLTFLSLNAHAGVLTIYNTPYTYNANVVNYAQSNQFIIGKPKPTDRVHADTKLVEPYQRVWHRLGSGSSDRRTVKPVNSRGRPPLPTAVHRFNVARHQTPIANHHSLSSMIKYMILKKVMRVENRSRAGVHQRKDAKKTLVLTLHYPLNVYALTPGQKVFLLAKLRHFKDKKLYVEGYTDLKGSKKYNNHLARDRAKTVVAFLNKHGFKAVEMPSFGKYHILKTAKKSRRVEIYAKK